MTFTKKVLVFAGDLQQAQAFISRSNRPADDYKVVSNRAQLREYSPSRFDFECVGTWRKNQAISEAYEDWRFRVLNSFSAR